MELVRFSKNLNDLLKAHKISQQTFANILGTTQATVNRWIKGINRPNYEDLISISIFFNESIDSLLGKDDLSEKQIEDIKNTLLSKIKTD